MTERKTNDIADKQTFPEMALGHTFLTDIEAKFLKLRSKYRRHKNISITIQELIQPAIAVFEHANDYERERQLRGYAEQVFNKSEITIYASENCKPPTYIVTNWILPKTLMSRLSHIANQVWCDPQSLMNCILTNAIDMKTNS